MKRWLAITLLALVIVPVACFAEKRGNAMTVGKGKAVSFDYALTVDGEVIDSSKGKEPLKYVHGQGQIIPGLSKQLEGLRAGDERSVRVKPEEGYGEVNPDAFREIAKTQLPPDAEPEVGMLLQVKTPQGGIMPVKITEIRKDSVIIDFNHPLAGKTLDFKVKIVTVQ